jgi:catechol 2,3-dioxygenase-like lactoylglutathione lyase family enzyme
MILGLRTAIYPAPDLARAKAWYGKVLGVEPYFDQPFYVGFSVGEGILVGAVKDPFGNRLGIIENPHFKASEVR